MILVLEDRVGQAAAAAVALAEAVGAEALASAC